MSLLSKLNNKKTIMVFLIFAGGAGIEFLSNIAFARILGKDSYGIYSYSINWLNLLIIPGLLGFGTSTLRFLPQYAASKNWSLYKGFLKFSSRAVITGSVITCILGIIMIYLYRSRLSTEEIKTMTTVFMAVPFFSLLHLSRFRFQSIQLKVLSLAPQKILLPILLVISITIGHFFFADQISAWFLSISYLAATILLLTTFNLIFNRKNRIFSISSGTNSESDSKKWLKVSIPMSFINTLQFLLKQTDVLMLGILIGTSVVGVYNAAIKINQVLLLGLLSINFIVTPQISKLYYSQQHNRLQKLITRSTRTLFAITCILALVILIGGKWILNFFGDEFTESYKALIILNIGNIFNAFSGSVGIILNMTGNQNVSFRIVLISVIINIILNYFLIPIYGIEGAAISTAIAVIIRNATMIFYVNKLTGINSTIIPYK